ncbi:carbohydrate porin [Cyanobium sp. WAJ14-Wanaka]|uniref:carbohydrate porin n=1 Tax=Cyanobium sp. WAJ14-Wanaka TaxID=2823725 RepID=UPI0020CF1D82|nr:carbohydrate porin [Cyanobium sp. WAJ14-Wanaka]MCP9774248.1 carbohydrate porin [Cyanobium sp. WAJ14-Wanaka]
MQHPGPAASVAFATVALALMALPSAAQTATPLTPDWLQLGLNIQSDLLGNPAGGTTKASNWIQQTTFNASASSGFGKDPAIWQEADHWSANVELTLFNGTPGYGQRLGSAFPLTAIDHPTGLWLTGAQIERSAGTGSVDIKAGIFSINPGFAEAPVLNFYVNSVFNNTLNLNITNLPINPFATPGIELNWRPGSNSNGPIKDYGPYGELRYGAFWLDPQVAIASLFGVNPQQDKNTGHIQALQWSFDRLPGYQKFAQPIQLKAKAGDGKQGSAMEPQPVSRQLPKPLLQIGGAYEANTTSNLLTPGFFSSITLAAPLPLGIDNRFWFGISGAGDNADSPLGLFLSGGWLSQGVIPGRPLDVLALAIGQNNFNATAGTNLNPETSLELNYTATVNSSLSLQPFLQWIINPGGTSSTGNILALGLQVQLQF